MCDLGLPCGKPDCPFTVKPILIVQPKGTRICGQIAVAHVTGESLERSIRVFGHKHCTSVDEVIKALQHFGLKVKSRRLRKLKSLPKMGIGKYRWRKPDGKLHGFHWVAIVDGKVLDGAIHSKPGEVTSVLVIKEK